MPVEHRLLQQEAAARTLLYGAVGLALLAAALWLVLAWLLSEVVSRVFLDHQTLHNVGGLLAVMAALMLVRAGLMSASDVIAQHSANRLKREMRGRLTAQLLALGPTYTRDERTGELVHATVEGVEALDEYISQYQPARLLAGLVPVLVFGVILVFDPWTLPILLFAGPILLILLALIGSRAKELTERRFQEMSWMSAHFLDMLQGLTTLKLFGRSKEQAATIETISRQYGNTTMDVLRTAFQTSLVLEWGATAATALVAIEVSVRLMAGQLPFDRALTVLLLTPEFFLPLRQLAMKYHAGSAGKAAAERIYAILDTPVAVGARFIAPIAPTIRDHETLSPLPSRLDIRFDDVHVAYDSGQRPALNGFTLSITQGQTVALVGATGAGKTTVANLLLRFVEPTRGGITVGGARLNEIDPAQWRTLVAWVPQHPHLFHGTVAENLRLARPDAAPEAVVEAARAAYAHEFIERLPHAYDTPIGEHGARLSGGQRQRLAIARAFLKSAPLLILDEPTSHLDPASEELLRDALARLVRNRTVLIISHRLALASDADTIVVMDEGRVLQEGRPRALAHESGMYQRLITAYEGGTR
jgi:ATP-binding cassette subfamily C protein CydD